MSQNLCKRLNQLEDELQCIIEIKKNHNSLERGQKCCKCCKCRQRSSASSSPSRIVRDNLAISKSKSAHSTTSYLTACLEKDKHHYAYPFSKKFNCATTGPQRSRRQLATSKCPCKPCPKRQKVKGGLGDKSKGTTKEIQVLHDASTRRRVLETQAIQSRSSTTNLPSPKTPRLKSPTPKMAVGDSNDKKSRPSTTPREGKCVICDPKRCLQMESLTKDLKNELELMKNQISSLEESKRLALETTKQLKEKYDGFENPLFKMGGSDEALTKNAQKNLSDSEDFFSKLDDVRWVPQSVPEGPHPETKTHRLAYSNLNFSLKEKDDYIRSLSDTNNNLLKTITEKDKEIKMLRETLNAKESGCQCMAQAVGELKEDLQAKDGKYEKLLETLNAKEEENKLLAKSIDALRAELKQAAAKSKKLQKTNGCLEDEAQDLIKKHDDALRQLGDCKTRNKQYEQEIEKFKLQLRSKEADSHAKEGLLKKIEDGRFREEQLKDKVHLLQAKLCELETINMGLRKVSDQELHNLMEHNSNLQQKYDELLNKLRQYEQEDAERTKMVEDELIYLKHTMSESERALVSQKEEMKGLIGDLTSIVKEQKQRIDELLEFNRQQEELLRTQSNVILNKDEQVKKAEAESLVLKCKCEEMQRQAELLRRSLEALESFRTPQNYVHVQEQNEINRLLDALEQIKVALEEERDKVLLKDKIIEDQTKTIDTLKNKVNEKIDELKKSNEELRKAANEIKRASEEIAKLENDLESEKQDKTSLERDIKNLEGHKEQLKQKAEDLERKVQDHCNCPHVLELKKQQEVIASLKRQLEDEQRDWDVQFQFLNQEKCNAITAAKFATQKLLDTVQDFQKQVDTQQQVQRVLTELLHDKDEKIKNTVKQMSSMTLHLAGSHGGVSLKSSHPMSRSPSKRSGSPNTTCSCWTSDEERSKPPESTSSISDYATPTSGGLSTPKYQESFQRPQPQTPNSPRKYWSAMDRVFAEMSPTTERQISSISTGYYEVDLDAARSQTSVEEVCTKIHIPPPVRRNIYYPPSREGDEEKPKPYPPQHRRNIEQDFEEIMPPYMGTRPVEEVCNKVVYNPPIRKNMYWPPNSPDVSDYPGRHPQANIYAPAPIATATHEKRMPYGPTPVVEEIAIKKVIKPPIKRNMYWPAHAPDLTNEVNAAREESVDPRTIYATLQPVEEEVCTRTVIKQPIRRNMYYPPNQNN